MTLFCRKLHAIAQFLDLRLCRLSADLDKIFLGDVRRSVCQLRGDVAVVGQQQQPFAQVIEPPHRIHSRGNRFHQVHHRRAIFGIGDRGDVALRLVEQHVHRFFGA